MIVRPPLVLFLLACAPLIASGLSYPIPPVQEGFVNSGERAGWPPDPTIVQHLPANARGVIYQAQLPDAVRHLDQVGQHAIYSGIPGPLKPSAFTVSGTRQGQSAVAVLTRLNQALPPAPIQGRSWAATGSLLRCMSSYVDSAICGRLARHSTDDDAWITQRVKQGYLVPIDRELKEATGVFRVSPAGGWRAGDHLRFTARRAAHQHGAAYASAISVQIDSVQIDTGAAQPRLVVDGALGMEFQPHFMRSEIALIQNFRIDVPASYKPYRLNVLTFLDHAKAGLPLVPYQQVVDNDTGIRSITITSLCEVVPQAESYYRVRAFAGMLEINDQLHETATMKVHLGDPAKGCGAVQMRSRPI